MTGGGGPGPRLDRAAMPMAATAAIAPAVHSSSGRRGWRRCRVGATDGDPHPRRSDPLAVAHGLGGAVSADIWLHTTVPAPMSEIASTAKTTAISRVDTFLSYCLRRAVSTG